MEALDEEKTNALTNLINHQTNHEYSAVDKIYLYDKQPYKPKYQLLIKKRGDAVIKQFNNAKLSYNIQTLWIMSMIILTTTI